MRRSALIILMCLAAGFLAPNDASAQFFRLTDYSVTANSVIPITDLDGNVGGGLQFNMRNAFMDRFSVDLEVGASYLQGNGWATLVTPVGFRYKYVPPAILGRRNPKFTPFATAGASLIYYNNLQLSDSLNAGLSGVSNDPTFADMELVRGNGLTLGLPFRTGVIYRKSDFMDIELSAGYNLILSDGLDRASSGQYDGMLTFGLGVNFKNRGQKRNGDSDGDGISDKREKELGLNPKNPDSDSDGLLDGEELNMHKTNPFMADTDGDGLLDGQELMVYFTDPLNPDTDGDGYSDYEEIEQGSDPLDPNSVPRSPEEDLNSFNSQDQNTSLDPTLESGVGSLSMDEPDKTVFFDQDKRTLTPAEVQAIRQFAQTKLSDPASKVFLAGHADLSGKVKSPIYNAELAADRAKAVREILVREGVNRDRIVIKSYGFDQQKEAPDALRDQHQLFRKVDMIVYNNEEELQQLLEQEEAPQPSLSEGYQTLAPGNRLAILYFMYASTRLNPASQTMLEELSTFLRSNPQVIVRIEGHTDAVGPTNVNQQVSVQRAEAIKQQMQQLGVAPNQIQTRGYGESRPLMLNDTELGRSMNRRIEIIRAQ